VVRASVKTIEVCSSRAAACDSYHVQAEVNHWCRQGTVEEATDAAQYIGNMRRSATPAAAAALHNVNEMLRILKDSSYSVNVRP
jgi:hypothetical protein